MKNGSAKFIARKQKKYFLLLLLDFDARLRVFVDCCAPFIEQLASIHPDGNFFAVIGGRKEEFLELMRFIIEPNKAAPKAANKTSGVGGEWRAHLNARSLAHLYSGHFMNV